MNKLELEQRLADKRTFQNASDEEVIEHFDEKFEKVPYKDSFLYVFNHDREFSGREHIIALHPRQASFTPMHIFHYIVMTYVYSGTLSITVDESTINLNAGDLIIFDRHVPHSVDKTSGDDLGINIIIGENYFSKRFINHLPNDHHKSKFMHELMNNQNSHIHYLVFKTGTDELAKDCIDNILCEHFDPSICSDELIDNFIMILVTHLFRKFQYDTNLDLVPGRNDELMEDISSYIQANFIQGNLTSMCQELGYDPTYASKLIKRHFGQTFKQLVNTERMKKASILLHNKSLPIYEIAQTVGINNLTSFYSRFKDYAGCTPQEYRDKFD